MRSPSPAGRTSDRILRVGGCKLLPPAGRADVPLETGQKTTVLSCLQRYVRPSLTGLSPRCQGAQHPCRCSLSRLTRVLGSARPPDAAVLGSSCVCTRGAAGCALGSTNSEPSLDSGGGGRRSGEPRQRGGGQLLPTGAGLPDKKPKRRPSSGLMG